MARYLRSYKASNGPWVECEYYENTAADPTSYGQFSLTLSQDKLAALAGVPNWGDKELLALAACDGFARDVPELGLAS